MKTYRSIFRGGGGAIFALMFAQGANAAVETVDWSSVSSPYTVPADTTNEVATAEDFTSFTSRVSKVIFANENSALRFTVSTYPNGVSFEGAGTAVFAEELAAGTMIAINRGSGDAGSGNFVKFDFTGGVNTSGTKGSVTFTPATLTNTTVFCHGMNSPALWNSIFDGRFDFDDAISLSQMIHIGARDNSLGVVRQHGGLVSIEGSNDPQFGMSTCCVAYFLEGGSLHVHPKYNRWYAYGRYIHFRQTGGEFATGCWQRPDSANDENTVPADFIYGGTAVASAPLEDSTPMFGGSVNLIVMDNAHVYAKNMPAKDGCGYKRMVALNGGLLEMNTRSSSGRSPVYFSFNGGVLSAGAAGKTVFGNPAQSKEIIGSVRVYEGGGTVRHFAQSTSDAGSYCYLPEIREPEGNVVKSVEITSELAGRVWQVPPSVEIVDSTGAGSNALAIADYDFDSGRVTNITVVSGGENYTAGAVTANLRYKAGETLLETPLSCIVGPCQGGDFMLCATNQGTFRVSAATNTYHGATIVNTDMSGEADHKTTESEYRRSLYIYGETQPRFLNSTSIVVRSGCLRCQKGGDLLGEIFPDCVRLELYGGHIADKTYEFKDVLIGGETWLQSHAGNRQAVVKVPSDGIMTVDFGAVETNGVLVVPALKYGKVAFDAGSRIALKNWESLPRGRKVVVLDMHEVATKTGFDLPVIVQDPDNGILSWDDTNGILYARRRSDGMFLIFR